MATPPPTGRHVVFIVDTTAGMGPHLPVLRDAYLDPLIRTVMEQSAAKREKVELGMVTFRDYPPAGNYVVRVSGFTRDAKQFGAWMDRLDFAGGGHQTVPLADAFAAAFHLSYERPIKERYFVLVSNTAPYQQGIPARLYSIPGQPVGSTATDIAAMFPKGQIALSVVAPRQLNELADIYQKAAITNVSELRAAKPDTSHMVLLRGLKIAPNASPAGAGTVSPGPSVTTASSSSPSAVAAGGGPMISPGAAPVGASPTAAGVGAPMMGAGPGGVSPGGAPLGVVPAAASPMAASAPAVAMSSSPTAAMMAAGSGVASPSRPPTMNVPSVPGATMSAPNPAMMAAIRNMKPPGGMPPAAMVDGAGIQPPMKKAKTEASTRPAGAPVAGLAATGMASPQGGPSMAGAYGMPPGGNAGPGGVPTNVVGAPGGGGVGVGIGVGGAVAPGGPMAPGDKGMMPPTGISPMGATAAVGGPGGPSPAGPGGMPGGVGAVAGAAKPPPTVINLTSSAGGLPTPAAGGPGPGPSPVPNAAAPTMAAGQVGVPSSAVASNKPIWEGTLAWHQNQSVGPLCTLLAYPRTKVDPASYGTKEWPSQLVVTGVCASKDALQMHLKQAIVLHFSVHKIVTPAYSQFLNQLTTRSWAAVIGLPSKTLFLIPHKDTLLGLIHTKQQLNIRPFSTIGLGQPPQQGQPGGAQQGVQGAAQPGVVSQPGGGVGVGQGQPGNPAGAPPGGQQHMPQAQPAQAPSAVAAVRRVTPQGSVPGTGQPMGGFPGVSVGQGQPMGGQLQGVGMGMGQPGSGVPPGGMGGGQPGGGGGHLGPMGGGQGMAMASGGGHAGAGGGFPGQTGAGHAVHSFAPQHMGGAPVGGGNYTMGGAVGSMQGLNFDGMGGQAPQGGVPYYTTGTNPQLRPK